MISNLSLKKHLKHIQNELGNFYGFSGIQALGKAD
jgi:hypothetical protein